MILKGCDKCNNVDLNAKLLRKLLYFCSSVIVYWLLVMSVLFKTFVCICLYSLNRLSDGVDF